MQKIAFIHIPKTAGMSLSNIIEENYDTARICPRHPLERLVLAGNGILDQYDYFVGHYYFKVLRAILGDSVQYITMLRNPQIQFLSYYNHIVLKNADHFAHAIAKRKSFSEFLQDERICLWLKNIQCQYLCLDLPMAQLVENADDKEALVRSGLKALEAFARRSDEDIFEEAKSILEKFQFVGTTDTFNDCMAAIQRQLGVKQQFCEAVLNTHLDVNASLQPDLRDMEGVADLTGADAMLYEYVRNKLARASRPSASAASPSDGYCYTLQNMQFERGWHGLERNGQGLTFRWTGPETCSLLKFRFHAEQDVSARIRVLDAMASDILDSLAVKVNGELKRCERFAAGNATVLQFKITAEDIGQCNGVVEISICVERTVSPAESGSGDVRRLGVAIHSIRFQQCPRPSMFHSLLSWAAHTRLVSHWLCKHPLNN